MDSTETTQHSCAAVATSASSTAAYSSSSSSGDDDPFFRRRIRKESFVGGPIPCVAFISHHVCLYGQGSFLNKTCFSSRQQQQQLDQKLLVFNCPSTGGNGDGGDSGNIHGIRHVHHQQRQRQQAAEQVASYTIVFGGRKLAFVKGTDDVDDVMELLSIQKGTTVNANTTTTTTITTFYELSDWIWDVKFQHVNTQTTPATKDDSSNAVQEQQQHQQQLLLVGLAHNQVVLLEACLRPADGNVSIHKHKHNSSNNISNSHVMWIQPLRIVQGITRCISYCMDIHISYNHHDNHNQQHATIAVGTVMNDILIWKIQLVPESQQQQQQQQESLLDESKTSGTNVVIQHEHEQEAASHADDLLFQQYKLSGHKGVLLAVRFNCSGSLLASASDDRSVRLWTRFNNNNNKNNSRNDSSNNDSSFSWKEKWTSFGHSARCWNVAFCQNDYSNNNNPYNGILLSTGEDGTTRLWHIETGAALAVLRGHAAGAAGIWSIDVLQLQHHDDDDDGNNNNNPIPQRIAMTGANNGTVAFYNLDGYMTNVNNANNSNNNNNNHFTSCTTNDSQTSLSSSPSPLPFWTRQILIPDDRPRRHSLQQSNHHHTAQDVDTKHTNHISDKDDNGNDVMLSATISGFGGDANGNGDKKMRNKKKKMKIEQQVIVGMSFYSINQEQIPPNEASLSSLALLVATRSGSLMSLIIDKSQQGEIVHNNNNNNKSNIKWIHHDGGWIQPDAAISASDGCCMALHPSSSLVAIGTMRGDIVLTRLLETAPRHDHDRSQRRGGGGCVLNARELKSTQQLKWLEHDVLLSLHIRSARQWTIPPSLLRDDGDITTMDDYTFLQCSSRTFQLTAKQSVVSCAAFHKQTNRLILGDTRGNLSLFDTTLRCNQQEDGSGSSVDAPLLLPVSVLHRVHEKEHINDIIWMNDGRVLSVGNDGCVHECGIDLQSGTLYPRLSLPVAGFTGITRLWETSGGNVVLAGYRGNELAIMDYNTGYEIFRKDTGGRARAAAIDLGLQQCYAQLSVVVCANERDGRNGLLFEICDDLVGYECKDDSSGRQRLVHSIGIGLHHESIYDACLFPFGARSDVLAFLTGSEDCSARISVWKQGTLTTSRPLPSQESGVRAVCSSRHAGSTTALMVVGGAKLSLQFFSLDDLVDDDTKVPVTFLGWGRSPETALIDHRINTVKATPIHFENGNDGGNAGDDGQHLVAAGDSNGSLYIYKVSQTQNKRSWCYIGTLAFRSSRPILSLEFLRMDDQPRKQNDATILLLLVGTTAGTVHVIDVSAAAAAIITLDPPLAASKFPVTPLASYRAHSMGVNAIAAAPRLYSLQPSLESEDGSTVSFRVCSGGDDQALCCATIMLHLLTKDDDNDNDETALGRFNVEIADLIIVKEASASALKGVYWIDEIHFVSVGYSQRLELWRYNGQLKQSLDRVACIGTEVGDVCCLAACHEIRQGGKDRVIMSVGGAGVEFFSL